MQCAAIMIVRVIASIEWIVDKANEKNIQKISKLQRPQNAPLIEKTEKYKTINSSASDVWVRHRFDGTSTRYQMRQLQYAKSKKENVCFYAETLKLVAQICMLGDELCTMQALDGAYCTRARLLFVYTKKCTQTLRNLDSSKRSADG